MTVHTEIPEIPQPRLRFRVEDSICLHAHPTVAKFDADLYPDELTHRRGQFGMSRSTRLAVAALVALPLLASCGSEPTEDQENPTPSPADSETPGTPDAEMPTSPTVYTADTSAIGAEMAVGGRLALIEGVCYGVEPTDGSGVLRPVVFPEGVDVEGDQGIRTPSGLIRIGEEVWGSGLASDASDSYAVEAGLPTECAGDDDDSVIIMARFDSPE